MIEGSGEKGYGTLLKEMNSAFSLRNSIYWPVFCLFPSPHLFTKPSSLLPQRGFFIYLEFILLGNLFNLSNILTGVMQN